MPNILITSMGGAGSLNLVDTIRLFDKKGDYNIIGTHFDPLELAKCDLDDIYVVPKAVNVDEYCKAHHEIIERHNVDLLIANSDREVASFSEQVETIRCKHLIPNQSMVDNVQDKFTLHEILSRHDNPVVRNVPIKDRDDIENAVSQMEEGKRFWIRLRKGAGSLGATWMYTADQARKWVDVWCELRGFKPSDFVVAPFLPGRDFCVALLFQEGELVVGKIYERLRYATGGLSISGMGSTPGASQTIDEKEPVDTCIKAVRSVCTEFGETPHGFYQLDMKADEAGMAYVTEINIGRFPMTSPQFDRVGKHSMLELYIDMLLNPEKELPKNVYDFDPGVLMLRGLDLPCTFVRQERVDEIAKRTV